MQAHFSKGDSKFLLSIRKIAGFAGPPTWMTINFYILSKGLAAILMA